MGWVKISTEAPNKVKCHLGPSLASRARLCCAIVHQQTSQTATTALYPGTKVPTFLSPAAAQAEFSLAALTGLSESFT